jgi:hypothetical protein
LDRDDLFGHRQPARQGRVLALQARHIADSRIPRFATAGLAQGAEGTGITGAAPGGEL